MSTDNSPAATIPSVSPQATKPIVSVPTNVNVTQGPKSKGNKPQFGKKPQPSPVVAAPKL